MKQKNRILVIITGIIIGAAAILLVKNGNPGNMGMCIACFIRDTAGAIGLHRAPVVQYIRPEIIGLVIGALIMSVIGKEFAPRGGSSPALRFILGICVMIGALVFLGCPLRMMLRIGGGDLNALVGLAGFIFGIVIGIFFLNKGFSLKRSYKFSVAEGLAFPAITLGLLALLIIAPAFIFFSKEGPGSMAAPIALSLALGTIIGLLAQKTRFCTVAGIRDTIMFKDPHMLFGFLTVIITVVVGSLIVGSFNLGFDMQPIAHSDGLWNFLGLTLVGFASVLLGGCPLRQLILAGEGNTDSVVTIVGLFVGAAICHNFGLASSADGSTTNGQIATIVCLVIVLIIAITNLQKIKKA